MQDVTETALIVLPLRCEVDPLYYKASAPNKSIVIELFLQGG